MRAFLAGRFVVFDGPDGCGKSTQFRRFADWAAAQGVVVTEVREPGGTSIGEQIRAVLLDPRNDAMTVRAEMLLYMASRAQLLEERIRPALLRGELVLADRFVSSTLAYQGTAGGMLRDEIMDVARVAVGDMWPDEIVIFDVDTETAWKRMAASGRAAPDRMEQKDAAFHQRVREGYLQQVGLQEQAMLRQLLSCAAIGTLEQVREQMQAFIAATGADELMVAGQIYDHQARLDSYAIAAEAGRSLEAVPA
jgi:dTMP kinase